MEIDIRNIKKKNNTGLADERVLCAASAYDKKFYLNPRFSSLPESIKDELKIISVLFTEETGGILTMIYDDDGSLYLYPSHNDTDVYYDEISCGLEIKKMQKERKELFESLEEYYKAFYMNKEQKQ